MFTGLEVGEDEDSVLYFPHHTSLYVRMLLQFFYTGTYTVHGHYTSDVQCEVYTVSSIGDVETMKTPLKGGVPPKGVVVK